MFYFLIYFFVLVILNSIRSARNYRTINKVYENLRFYKFKSFKNIMIANDGTKDEFVIVSEWNYRLPNNFTLYFDIWTLVDLHNLYWLFKFRNFFKEKNKFSGGHHILFF